MKSRIVIVLILLNFKTFSQINIKTILSIKGLIEFKDLSSVSEKKQVTKIIVKETSFSRVIKKFEHFIYLNKRNKITSYVIKDSKGANFSSFFAFYDNDGERLIKTKGGYGSISLRGKYNYVYDENNFIIEVNQTDKYGNIFRKNYIKNNRIGLPVEIRIEDSYREVNFKELANYSFSENTFTSKILDNKGKVLSLSKNFFINKEDKIPSYKYNEYGDLVETDKLIFKYKYDENSNWIKLIISDKKHKKVSSYKRKIFYN